MKLKIRAESKDATIFIIFAVFLLYLVAVGVLNLSSFASFGEFYGLNPIEAFSGRFIVPTIIFYLIALGSLFFTTGSYFFDLEEGIGFSIGSKKEKGYSRWATAKEMKKELKLVYPHEENSRYAGIPLINNGKEIWVDDSHYHNLVIGSTGSGKTTAVIFPMVRLLAKHNESMIITDPKGEIYEKMAVMLKSRGYNIVLLNFRNPQNGNSWNPLSMPYNLYKNGNQDKSIELLDDLALNILYDETNKNADPFWEKTSADYFSGIALGLFEDADPSQININSISLMSTVGEEKFGGSTYIKEYFNGKDPTGSAFINASSTILAPSETKGGILAVFKQKIKLFASRENLSEMLSHSDFDLSDIGKKKTALFIIIQDEKKTYHSLATILLKQCYETLIDVAQDNGGELPIRTNFLVDEFANMPPLKDIDVMITAARSRKIRFTLIIQNFAQLNEIYGKETAETIKGNCGNMLYLISTELAALEEISKMCGEVKSKEKDKTASTPLITVTDLQKLKLNEVIIRRIRLSPFKTKLKAEYEMNWGRTYPKAQYPVREKQPINIFDMRTFVKEKKKAKMNEILNMDASGSDPMGGFNPNMPPFFNQNMFNSESPPVQANPYGMNDLPPNNNDFNIDDLVKKIDQKIAELEEEEKRNNLAIAAENTNLLEEPKASPNLDQAMDNFKIDQPMMEEKQVAEVSPSPGPVSSEKIVDSDVVNQPKNNILEAVPIPNNNYFEPISKKEVVPANINYRDLYNDEEDSGGAVREMDNINPKAIYNVLESTNYELPKEDRPIIKDEKPLEDKVVVSEPVKEEQPILNADSIPVNEEEINDLFKSLKNNVEEETFFDQRTPLNNSFSSRPRWFAVEEENQGYTAVRRPKSNNQNSAFDSTNHPNDKVFDKGLPEDSFISQETVNLKPVDQPVVVEKVKLETDDLFKPKDANLNWFSEHENDIKSTTLAINPENLQEDIKQETVNEETEYNEITDDQFFDDFFDD